MIQLPLTLNKKAFLLSIGSISLLQDIQLKDRQSVAGPSAGSRKSIFILSNNKRVRLLIDINSPIKGKITEEKNITLYYNNKPVLNGVIDKILAHCPEQAYVTISEKCIFNCKFCVTPQIGTKIKTINEVLEILNEAWEKKHFKAISITSGVFNSPSSDLKYILNIITSIKKKYFVPIGVSIVASENCSSKLKEIGVSEVKYNLETFDIEIFNNICPNMNYKFIMKELINAVKIFGKGHVYTNIIIGLGEKDSTIINGIELMAKNGIIVNLRPVSPIDYRIKECNMIRPSKDRLLTLYKYHREILKKYQLSTLNSLSMCSLCCACDLTPEKDDDDKII